MFFFNCPYAANLTSSGLIGKPGKLADRFSLPADQCYNIEVKKLNEHVNQKIQTWLGAAILAIFAITALVFVKIIDSRNPWPEEPETAWAKKTKPAGKACTMEAKLCPDGKTSVGRSGPRCEFEPCPERSPVGPQNAAASSEDVSAWEKKYGIEFQHPDTWKPTILDETLVISNPSDDRIVFAINIKYSGSIDEWSLSEESNGSTVSRTTFKGQAAAKSILGPTPLNYMNEGYYFIKNGVGYDISYSYAKGQKEADIVGKKILSTFKFTEQE